VSSWRDALLARSRDFLEHAMFSRDVDEMPLPEVAELWGVLDHLVRALEARKQAARARLLGETEKLGKPTEKGGDGRKLELGPFTLYRKVTGGHDYDRERVMDLLASKGIGTKNVIVPKPAKVTYTVSGPALEVLRFNGAITAEELGGLRQPPTVSLLVQMTPQQIVQLEEALPPLPGQERRGGNG